MKACIHPQLGEFHAQTWEWRVQRELSFSWGFSTGSVSIVQEEHVPSDEQFEALVDLWRKPASFREALAAAIFDAYTHEIRSDYLAMLEHGEYDDLTAGDLPELGESAEAWKLVTGLHSLWVSEDASIDIQFAVTFDPEHELHVQVVDGVIDRVWME
jgi:hypothetical protein